MHLVNPVILRLKATIAVTAAFIGDTAEASNAPGNAIITGAHDATPQPGDAILIPRNAAAKRRDDQLVTVREWLEMPDRPVNLSDEQYTRFLRYCACFFVAAGKLWRKDA